MDIRKWKVMAVIQTKMFFFFAVKPRDRKPKES